MKEYIKKFETTLLADGYIINDIPFTTSISSVPVQNLVCNQENKKITIDSQGNASIDDTGPVVPNNEIWYTSSDGKIIKSIYIPAFPTIVSHTYVDGKGVIKFATDVTSIGGAAFSRCSSLTSINIPNSVTSIETFAFHYCNHLTSVTIGNSVTNIGDSAFYGCSSLTHIEIPASVISIGTTAFGSCSSLTHIEIPASVISIGDYVFSYCRQLTSIVVAVNNPNYCSEDGVLFNKDKTTLMMFPGGKQGVCDIPNSVTHIGQQAFGGCAGLTSVTIPNSVTSIENSAFRDCTSLTSINIPNSVTSIGHDAFYWCDSLTSVMIGNSVTSIGSDAFSGCSSLASVTIPDSVISIGECTFYDCWALTSVTIGNRVTNIGDQAFYGCSLTSIEIPNSVTNIGIGSFTCGEGSYTGSLGTITVGEIDYTYDGESQYFTIILGNGTSVDLMMWIDPSCFLPDTEITLSDGTKKQIKDITYNDKLKVWNFDEGHYDEGEIAWLTKVGLKNDHYYQLTFSDGTILKTTGKNSNHKVYCTDTNKFEGVAYIEVGAHVFTENGIVTITDKQYIEEEVEYYNLITKQHFNCFANGVLTSDRYGNIYPISDDMIFIKNDRPIRPYSEFEAVGIKRYWYDTLRLGENTETVDETKRYIMKLESQMRKIEQI